jgi:hypothetical protein
MSEGNVHGKRTFSYAEARALLPRVRELTEVAYRTVEAIEARRGAEGAPQEIESVVSEWARRVVELGLEVKGVWLADFDNGSGYYCWRYPEDDLLYFHSYEEGFKGRMRIQ